MRRFGWMAMVVVTLLSPSICAARAQTVDSSAHASPLFTKRDAFLGVGFAALTLALLPMDRVIAERLQDSATQSNRFLAGAATDFERAAVPGAYLMGGVLYAAGRLGHLDRVADLGLHGTEAVFMAVQITDIVKGLAGRARPSVVGDSVPGSFEFARGLRKEKGYTSFPSGHTAKAFGAAAAVTAEVVRWSPGSRWIVGPVMYGSALMVGLSRMYHNAHWASDVALGAGIGTFSGIKVVRYNHHRRTRLDRWLLRAQLSPGSDGGMALKVFVPF
ncbi:MAG TPA: phosphatase PAP2 family protein [Gemmatimonadaceae bacterium]